MLTGNKRIAMERDYDVDLLLSIDHAEGLDNPSSYPPATTRDYRVVFWVHPDDQLATSRDGGSPDPAWNQKCRIKLDKSKDCRFLYVEVLRYGSSSESNPGTSNGISLVGRAQIPLPSLSCKTAGRYGPVRPEEDAYKAEGHIILSMKLVKIDIINITSEGQIKKLQLQWHYSINEIGEDRYNKGSYFEYCFSV